MNARMMSDSNGRSLVSRSSATFSSSSLQDQVACRMKFAKPGSASLQSTTNSIDTLPKFQWYHWIWQHPVRNCKSSTCWNRSDPWHCTWAFPAGLAAGHETAPFPGTSRVVSGHRRLSEMLGTSLVLAICRVLIYRKFKQPICFILLQFQFCNYVGKLASEYPWKIPLGAGFGAS